MPDGQGLEDVHDKQNKKNHFPCKNTFKDKEDMELSILCQRKMEEEKV